MPFIQAVQSQPGRSGLVWTGLDCTALNYTVLATVQCTLWAGAGRPWPRQQNNSPSRCVSMSRNCIGCSNAPVRNIHTHHSSTAVHTSCQYGCSKITAASSTAAVQNVPRHDLAVQGAGRRFPRAGRKPQSHHPLPRTWHFHAHQHKP